MRTAHRFPSGYEHDRLQARPRRSHLGRPRHARRRRTPPAPLPRRPDRRRQEHAVAQPAAPGLRRQCGRRVARTRTATSCAPKIDDAAGASRWRVRGPLQAFLARRDVKLFVHTYIVFKPSLCRCNEVYRMATLGEGPRPRVARPRAFWRLTT